MPELLIGQFKVSLVRHLIREETPVGSAEIDAKQYKVIVESEFIKGTHHRLRNDTGRLQVGIIGAQKGANFCPLQEFGEFTPEQQKVIVAEAKRLHGQASGEPPHELPPDLEILESSDEEIEAEE